MSVNIVSRILVNNHTFKLRRDSLHPQGYSPPETVIFQKEKKYETQPRIGLPVQGRVTVPSSCLINHHFYDGI